MGDVPWMVAIFAVQTIVSAVVCTIIEKKTVCIDQSKKDKH